MSDEEFNNWLEDSIEKIAKHLISHPEKLQKLKEKQKGYWLYSYTELIRNDEKYKCEKEWAEFFSMDYEKRKMDFNSALEKVIEIIDDYEKQKGKYTILSRIRTKIRKLNEGSDTDGFCKTENKKT